MNNWTKEEIRLTRYAWWLHDANERMERNREMREVIYMHLVAWLIVAIICWACI